MRHSLTRYVFTLSIALHVGCGSSADTAKTKPSPDAGANVDACSPSDGSVPPEVTRRAVAVIVDFADATLEDWQGPGFNTEGEVRAQLDAMEAHWLFLSRGLEPIQWDLIRIRLPENLTDTAFPGFNEFRDAAVTLAKQQLTTADYDANADGVIDTMWLVVSNNGTRPPYLVGGASQNAGANDFVDGQDSDSVIGGVTGNFNHEVGHTRGLPDLYGRYDSVQDLTLMSSSWPLPPNDFSAYERVHLGWVVPQTITASTRASLPSANTHLAAIKVPTARPEEYFLLEYRQRPQTGFGSAAPFNFDGIAVYHVFEGSNQDLDPPLVKLEPADGTTATTLTPAPTDFAYPGNPAMLCPFVLRTYFGGDPVFQLQNLARLPDGSIAFDLTILSSGIGSAPNLIANSTFESGTAGWITGGFQPQLATFTWAALGANGSGHSLSINAPVENDVEWSTPVSSLTAGRNLFMCGFVRGAGITGGAGGSISISGTFIQTAGLHGTFDFTRECAVVTAFASTMSVACRLGGFAATTSGSLWCDDVSLVPLTPVFTGTATPPPPFE
jgi:hypothetical protein